MLSLGATLVVSLSAAAAGSGAVSVDVTCVDEPTSHLGAWVMAGGTEDAAEPPVYATPAEVECPTPATGRLVLGDATCDETPPPDLWYRISTAAAGERATSTLVPARRAHGGRASLVAGAPLPDTRHVAPPDFQPVALYALFAPLISGVQSGVSFTSDTLPARTLAPPDRPPRV